MARHPNVRLDLINRAENVLLVRETLTGVAEATGLDGSDLNDVRTAVTEACNNVVLHAYGGEEGPLEVEIAVDPHTLRVTVRDHGVGIDGGALAGGGAGEPGIGIPVIQALSEEADFAEPVGGGTEVRMQFAAGDLRGLPAPSRQGPQSFPEMPDTATAIISVAPAELARAVVPRVLCAFAARANFSTDRISDSQLLADALVAHASDSLADGYLSIAVNVEPRDIELRVGPLAAGHAERLVLDSDMEGLGRVLEKLADSHGVTSSDAHDTLTLQLLDRC
jgi:anti-sigma regulatory factor (Ser/Thr protein kinase)